MKELLSLLYSLYQTMEWETRAKQKNAELEKLNTTTHEGFYVVYYYTYISLYC